MNPILLVEDDPGLGRGLVVRLELEGYSVNWTQTLREARDALKRKQFSLAILDRGLPDGDGVDLCQEIRGNEVLAIRDLPIIILTAQANEDSVVDGLSAGANDYVRKPFGHRELLARIKTVLREPSVRENRVRYGELELLPESRKVIGSDECEIELNRREFDVLQYLMAHAGAVVTRESLLSAIHKDGEIFDRTMDSHISHLRAKLRNAGVKSVQIGSVYGVGYRLEKK